jgi:hypothetical protein
LFVFNLPGNPIMIPAQLATLKAAILADPALLAKTSGVNTDYQFIASALSEPATPTFTVWKTRVSRSDVTGDGFDFTQVDNLTTGQARIFDWLFETGDMNPSLVSRRAGIAEAWKGTAAKLAVQTYVLGQCKRPALRVEKLLATGTGSDAVPAVLGYEGGLQASDIGAILV